MQEYTLLDGTVIKVNESQICYQVDNTTSLTLMMSNGQRLEVLPKNK